MEWHFKRYVELGIPEEEIREAIELANKVKLVPIKKINENVDRLLNDMNG